MDTVENISPFKAIFSQMRNMNTLTIVALILIFLGGIGAILLTVAQSISSAVDKNDIITTTKNENIELKKALQELKDERDSLSKSLAKRDENIQKQNAEIIFLSEKLSEKSDYIQNSLTGREGFLFIDIRSFYSQKNEVSSFLFRIENNFDFPQYNVSLDVFDYDVLESKVFRLENQEDPLIQADDYKAARILQATYDEIPPHEYRDVDRKFDVRPGRYYLQIHTRGRTTTEKIVVLKVGEGHYYGFQVFDRNGKMLQQLIKEDMPQHIQKQVLNQLNAIPFNLKLILSQ